MLETDTGDAGAEVPDEEILYRRTTHMQANAEDGKPNSSAFRTDHADGLSFNSGAFMTPQQALDADPRGLGSLRGLVQITAGQARAAGGRVYRDPLDPTHVLVQGLKGSGEKQLSRLAFPIRPPRAPG